MLGTRESWKPLAFFNQNPWILTLFCFGIYISIHTHADPRRFVILVLSSYGKDSEDSCVWVISILIVSIREGEYLSIHPLDDDDDWSYVIDSFLLLLPDVHPTVIDRARPERTNRTKPQESSRASEGKNQKKQGKTLSNCIEITHNSHSLVLNY